ncbi:hypothetical protein V6238_18725, partial [Marinomonas arenicola]|uniref:hypothetical protein n=1 Tax=Marinomonas arenicola TaxID=569601 RepID=UPI00311D8CD7
VMNSRNFITQGVFPNIFHFYREGIDFTYIWLALNYLSSYSLFATSLTLQDHIFDLSSFMIAINPLPSSYVDIDYIVETQKLNKNSPYPAISMLAFSGPYVVF